MALKDDNNVPLFSNNSVAAIFDAIARTIGDSIDTTLAEFANTQSIIDNNILTKNYGRYWWYVGKALAYQDGDSLIENIDTHDFYYQTIDLSKQIIKQAAFEDATNNYAGLKLKIATIDSVSGLLIKLSTVQKAAFDNYMRNFEIPGVPLTKISIDANILNFDFACQYSKNYNLSNIIAQIQIAFNNFQKTFHFNGLFYRNGLYGLENYIVDNIAGIIDFSISNMTLDLISFINYISLPSGYFNYDNSITDLTTGKLIDTANYTGI